MVTYYLREGQKGAESPDHEKDTGIVIDNKVAFEKHISEKIGKAVSVIGVISRTFEFLDQLNSKLYTSLVRLNFEYANQAWNSYLKKHLDLLKNAQR